MLKVAKLYHNILTTGSTVDPRGLETRELLNYSLKFSADEWFADFEELPLNYDYIRKELLWYYIGDRHDLSIARHAGIWNDMIDENNTIQSNYGFYFNDQIDEVAAILRADKDSRRAIININRPEHNYASASDVPCTISFLFMVRDDHLDLHVYMRSQDAVFGLRNDLPAFQAFKLRAATRLGLPPGKLYLTVASIHIYARHYEKCERVVADPSRKHRAGFTNIDDYQRWFHG